MTSAVILQKIFCAEHRRDEIGSCNHGMPFPVEPIVSKGKYVSLERFSDVLERKEMKVSRSKTECE